MLKNKIMIIAIAIIIVAGIATGTVLILKSVKSNDSSQTKTEEVTASADSTKTDAIKLMNSDPATAKTLLEKALQQYTELNDVDKINDVKAQLSLLEYQASQK